MTTHILRANMMHNKRTYRDIEILSSKNLVSLAGAILDAFQFGDKSHLFGFFSSLGGSYSKSPIKYELSPDQGLEVHTGHVWKGEFQVMVSINYPLKPSRSHPIPSGINY
ncbi:MAG: hypothetical protein HQL69_20385 [Magnetococcales bacterium]|nr:hypothetical protein [Magnetococcales bacterium]